MIAIGQPVLDRVTRAPAVVRSVVRVPRQCDLFGHPIKAYRRLVVVYDDGRWNHRREDECERLPERPGV